MSKRYYLAIIWVAATMFVLPVMDTYAADYTSEEYGKILEVVKDELRNGNLDSEEDIRSAIESAEEKYNVSISKSDEEKIVGIMDKVNDLGIDNEVVSDVLDDVYDKAINGQSYDSTEEMIQAVEDQIVDSATDKIASTVKEKVKKSIFDYGRSLVERIKAFFKRLIGVWSM